VGFNLLQSSFTNFCPLEMILRKLAWNEPSMRYPTLYPAAAPPCWPAC
jgi:hypothetical protein